ncbi:hypothetical protein MMC26_003592 [Xylographa opegraphella]|nr:hypothetical protein [Xylographa opegraphella]
MASLRRSTVLPSDSATSRFLYTILKQLDHKSIDWNTVASELDITNGHAARMRFSRFKQHMEGIPPTPRKPRTEPRQHKKAKIEKTAKAAGKRAKAEDSNLESGSMDRQAPANSHDDSTHRSNGKKLPFVKLDLLQEPEALIKPEPHIKPEHPVKEEPMDDWLYTAEDTEPSVSGLSSVVLANSSSSLAEQPIMDPSTSSEALPKLPEISDERSALKLEPHSHVKLESTDAF